MSHLDGSGAKGIIEFYGGQLDSGGGGVPIAAGSFFQFSVNNDYVIREARLLGVPGAGDITVDVLIADSFADYPTFNSITGGNPLTYSNDEKYQDNVLTGWDVNIPKGSIIRFEVQGGAVVVEQCACEILLQRV